MSESDRPSDERSDQRYWHLGDPAKNLNIALKVQLELDYTLDQLRSAVATVCRGPAITTNRSDDHHLKSLKSYRLHHLKTKLLSLYQRLCDTFVLASELIQQMGFTSELPKNLHQTDVLRSAWTSLFMEDPLKDLISRLNPSTDLTDENQEPTIKYVREPVIQLAKLALPIIKLIRIFYNKLSEGGLNRERLPRYTEMCSNQIESLFKSPDRLCIDIRDIVGLLDLANLNRAGVLPMAFLDVTNRLKTRFETSTSSERCLTPAVKAQTRPSPTHRKKPIIGHKTIWSSTGS
ncbi:hypothetical protein H4Q26_001006 [Puccinia striiformis f. sp. tritici PST-130]|nr:hypothetical protein H4Q26_001006 [Puccinia striiformis f. sp. tritici PST-130]